MLMKDVGIKIHPLLPNSHETPYVKREERERITGPMCRGMEEEGRERELGRL